MELNLIIKNNDNNFNKRAEFNIESLRDVEIKGSTFFDYSSAEKIKIIRAAGRQAQKEQQKLLKSYDSRFGRL